MATRKGKNSPEYTAVQVSLLDLTGHLDSNEGAKTDLTRHFKSKGWLTPVAQPTSDALIALVLEKIRVTPSEYDSFVGMLEEVVGSENIVQRLRGKCTLYILC